MGHIYFDPFVHRVNDTVNLTPRGIASVSGDSSAW